MRKWLYDRPWIWIVVLLTLLVASGIVVVIIAQVNKPTIVKEKTALVIPSQDPAYNRLLKS
jgi:hypothetical protein